MNTAVELVRCKSERRGQPKDGGDDHEDLHHDADGPLRAGGEQILHRAAERGVLVHVVAGVSHEKRDDGVDGPRRDGPVEVRPCKRRVSGEQGVGGVERGAPVHHDRLGHRPEHQAHALPGGEQHREPGEVRERGLGVLAAQADRTELRHRYEYAYGEAQKCAQHDPPAAVLGDERAQHANRVDERVGADQRDA